jgi:hypothetical protein
MGSATIVYTRRELEMRQIKSDVSIGDTEYQFLCELAEKWGVSVYAIAWLGGKPYPTQAALFKMFDDKREKEKLIVAGWETKPIQRATKEDIRAGYECFIRLFDKGCFDEATKKIAKEQMTVEMVEKLRGTYTYVFKEEGWASIQTVRMPAMQNIDYINHMAQTRAIDRTLRIIVRCPYTAASELPDGTPDGSVSIQQAGQQGPAPQPPTDESGGVMLSRPKRQEPVKDNVNVEIKVGAPITPPPDAAKPSEISPPVSVPAEKKDEKINEKQIGALMGRWGEYVKRRMSGLKGPQIEAKIDRLVKALYGHTSKKDITVGQLAELMDFMEKGEIEITEEEAPKEEPKVEAKS